MHTKADIIFNTSEFIQITPKKYIE